MDLAARVLRHARRIRRVAYAGVALSAVLCLALVIPSFAHDRSYAPVIVYQLLMIGWVLAPLACLALLVRLGALDRWPVFSLPLGVGLLVAPLVIYVDAIWASGALWSRRLVIGAVPMGQWAGLIALATPSLVSMVKRPLLRWLLVIAMSALAGLVGGFFG